MQLIERCTTRLTMFPLGTGPPKVDRLRALNPLRGSGNRLGPRLRTLAVQGSPVGSYERSETRRILFLCAYPVPWNSRTLPLLTIDFPSPYVPLGTSRVLNTLKILGSWLCTGNSNGHVYICPE